MRIKQAEFVISVADFKKCPQTDIPEIAIAGKSNVGKSSFINLLTNNKSLAKTSSAPGRTRLLNYFNINKGEVMLVDLPGYGFARVSDDEKNKWGQLIEGYLANSERLINVFVLVDSRHKPSALDIQMVAYLHHYCIPFTVIATKIDKLTKNELLKQKKIIADTFALTPDSIITTSTLKKVGVDKVLERMEEIISANKIEVDFEQEELLREN